MKNKSNIFKSNQFKYLIIIVIGINLGGCKISKKLGSSGEKKITGEQLIIYNQNKKDSIKWVWLKKINGEYNYGEETKSFNASIRIIKDSIIIISINLDLGIEALRIFVEKDSITIINRFNKTWFKGPGKEVGRKYGHIVNYKLLEQVLLMESGNKLQVYESIHDTKKSRDEELCYISSSEKDDIWEKVCYDYKTGYLKERLLGGISGKEEVKINYYGYHKLNNYKLPEKLVFKSDILNNELLLVLDYERVVVDEPFPAKLKISKSYTKVERLIDL